MPVARLTEMEEGGRGRLRVKSKDCAVCGCRCDFHLFLRFEKGGTKRNDAFPTSVSQRSQMKDHSTLEYITTKTSNQQKRYHDTEKTK
jgi:hypothetical protein